MRISGTSLKNGYEIDSSRSFLFRAEFGASRLVQCTTGGASSLVRDGNAASRWRYASSF
jgi:hypothetical protein